MKKVMYLVAGLILAITLSVFSNSNSSAYAKGGKGGGHDCGTCTDGTKGKGGHGK
jgi:hypothetical protein